MIIKDILSSPSQMSSIDKSNLLGSIEQLPEQIADAWKKARQVKFPASYKKAKNIVVSGMGGSALGSMVIKNLFKNELRVPFEIYNHYQLPAYVNSDTLVLLSSYSGSTEETLAAAQEAVKRQAKVVVIAAGGGLAELAQKHHFPLYLINPVYNPSNQPRMAIGYSITGQLAIFSKLGYLSISDQEIKEVVKRLKTATPQKMAQKLARAAYQKTIVFAGAEHLVGAAHVINNQTNENAKCLTAEWQLPELNHHYLEALPRPEKKQGDTIFILFGSSKYHPRVQARFPLSQQLITQAGYQGELVAATGKSKLEEVFTTIQWGAFFAYYLAMLYGTDPTPIPSVDWLKLKLSEI